MCVILFSSSHIMIPPARSHPFITLGITQCLLMHLETFASALLMLCTTSLEIEICLNAYKPYHNQHLVI